jgi:hypothetical protein
MIKKAIRTIAIIGTSAAIEAACGTTRVDTMRSSSGCLYMVRAVRCCDRTAFLRYADSDRPSHPITCEWWGRAFYKDGAGVRLVGRMCMDL